MALRVLGESASLDNFNRWLHLVKSCYLAMWFTSSDCQRKDLYEPYKFKSQIVTEGCDLALVAKKMLRSKTCGLDLLRPNTTRQSSPAKSPQPCPLDTLLNTPSNRRELKKTSGNFISSKKSHQTPLKTAVKYQFLRWT